MKKCVIMPLSGIDGDDGSLGECAYKFADKVAASGAEYWLLPELGENYVCAIDLELLRMDGLVTAAESKKVRKNKEARSEILRKAFTRFWKPDSYAEFEREHKDECADDYELFLRYEFSMQYAALVGYALSRGVDIVSAIPPNAKPVYLK